MKPKFILILIIFLAVFIIINELVFSQVSLGVTIEKAAYGSFFEDENNQQENDNMFSIGSIITNGSWYSYNGTNGGISSGYDSNSTSYTAADNTTQLFTFMNKGSISVDVIVSAEDFGNSSTYINVDKINGDFQIYVPNVGWKNVTDNNNTDADLSKDTQELCLINDLAINGNVSGIDFRIKAPTDLEIGNYTSLITLTTYDNTTINPCSEAGEYVTTWYHEI